MKMAAMNNEFSPAAQESSTFHRNSSRNRPQEKTTMMDTRLLAFLMFLLLTYLLFRRPASMAQKRYPTELNSPIGHSSLVKGELSKRTLERAGDHVEKSDVHFKAKSDRIRADLHQRLDCLATSITQT
ncbi:MAG TPA: hypothetical protein VIC84_05240 [Blastocatellia bacterium]